MQTPGTERERGPVVDYLLKEVSFSTCDNKFFGELEKEMLIPNNINIYGRIIGATHLHNHKLQVEFPENSTIAFLKRPSSNTILDGKRVLAYSLEDLLNFEDYWWLPLQGETEFLLQLNLLPPFPQINPVDLGITCTPDIAVGIETDITTTVSIKAAEHIDHMFLTMSVPPYASPGISLSISEYSGENLTGLGQTVTAPNREFPFPQLGLRAGELKEYKVKTRIKADVNAMTSLKCQHDVLRTKLVLLSESSPAELPCGISIIDEKGDRISVNRTERSTILQAQAQIMYSPFSIRREDRLQPQKKLVEAAAV